MKLLVLLGSQLFTKISIILKRINKTKIRLTLKINLPSIFSLQKLPLIICKKNKMFETTVNKSNLIPFHVWLLVTQKTFTHSTPNELYSERKTFFWDYSFLLFHGKNELILYVSFVPKFGEKIETETSFFVEL